MTGMQVKMMQQRGKQTDPHLQEATVKLIKLLIKQLTKRLTNDFLLFV